MNNNRGSLYSTMFMMVMLPMIIVTIAAAALCGRYYLNTVDSEVRTGLANICAIARSMMDENYPGDYELKGDKEKVILKGEYILNGDHTVPDRIKGDTGTEITIFYYDTRILTTITNPDGDRIVGTGANATVMRDVYEGQVPGFYPRVNISGTDYYAYYEPLFNSDESCVGMIFAGKKVSEVHEVSVSYLLPLFLIIPILLICEGIILAIWTRNTISHLGIIQEFLVVMSEGKFSRELTPLITGRNDEIGGLGAAVVKVQGAIRDLIERDVLTGLHNRRFGYARLDETVNMAKRGGIPFCVAMADIDHFKRFNDTYGHDAGDLVLKEVAKVLKTNIAGKGYAVRWGGEEFLLVFEDMDMERALEALENIRSVIKALEIIYMEETLKVTMSFGLAKGDINVTPDDFLKEADDRLYYAKANGRDRIVTLVPWWKEENQFVPGLEAQQLNVPAGNGLVNPGQLPFVTQVIQPGMDSPAGQMVPGGQIMATGQMVPGGQMMPAGQMVPGGQIMPTGQVVPAVMEGQQAQGDKAEAKGKKPTGRKRGRPKKNKTTKEE